MQNETTSDADHPQYGASLIRGTNQSGMRAHNERLVLSLIRQRGPMAKADIARATGLSAQTVSVIMRALESDGLLIKGDPVRGRVGQPSVPMRLAQDGAYFLGLKVGRRSLELVLIDFLGQVIDRSASAPTPTPPPTRPWEFARGTDRARCCPAAPTQRARVAGLGIAMPFFMWNWAQITRRARRADGGLAQTSICAPRSPSGTTFRCIRAERRLCRLRRAGGVWPRRSAARFPVFLHRLFHRRRRRSERRAVHRARQCRAHWDRCLLPHAQGVQNLIDVASLSGLEARDQAERRRRCQHVDRCRRWDARPRYSAALDWMGCAWTGPCHRVGDFGHRFRSGADRRLDTGGSAGALVAETGAQSRNVRPDRP